MGNTVGLSDLDLMFGATGCEGNIKKSLKSSLLERCKLNLL